MKAIRQCWTTLKSQKAIHTQAVKPTETFKAEKLNKKAETLYFKIIFDCPSLWQTFKNLTIFKTTGNSQIYKKKTIEIFQKFLETFNYSPERSFASKSTENLKSCSTLFLNNEIYVWGIFFCPS